MRCRPVRHNWDELAVWHNARQCVDCWDGQRRCDSWHDSCCWSWRCWTCRRIVHGFWHTVTCCCVSCRRSCCVSWRGWNCFVIHHFLHSDDKVEIWPLICVDSGLVEGSDKHVFLWALTFQRFQRRRHQTLKIVTGLSMFSVKEGDLNGGNYSLRIVKCCKY